MTKHYKDYLWDKGSPQGLSHCPQNEEETIKIVSDPYLKHISIEKYRQGKFIDLIYDSRLLDFRHLKNGDQNAWHKEMLKETSQEAHSLIRNQDDRVVFKEIYLFENNFCRECRTYSPKDSLLSIQKLFYTHLGDTFNGVMLYDNNNHLVMYKHYTVDQAGDFAELKKEEWSPAKNG